MAVKRSDLIATPVTHLALIGAGVFALVFADLKFTAQLTNLAAFWPANAVIAAALMKSEPKRWGAQLAAGVLAVLAADLVVGTRPWSLLGLGLCGGLDALLCAAGARLALGRDLDLTHGRHLAVFLAMASLIGPLASAVPAAWILSSAHMGGFAKEFAGWYSSTALGLLVLTPALMTLTPGSLKALVSRPHVGRTAAVFGLMSVCLAIVFLQTRFPLFYLILPVLILITFQLELAGGALAMLVTAAAVVASSALGGGSVGVTGLNDAVLQTQLFLAVTSLSVLVAAAVQGHQRRLTASLRQALNETETARAVAVEHQRWATMAEEIAGVGHWRRDERSGAVIWSDEIFRIFGLDPADGIPDLDAMPDLYHPDDRARVRANFRGARYHGQAFASELRVMRPNGEIRYVMERGAVERDMTGKVYALFGVVVDATETKRIERVLRESEERFRLLADKSNDIIMQSVVAPDLSLVMKYINPAVRSVLGHSPVDFEDPAYGPSLIHPDDIGPLRRSNREQMDEGAAALPRLDSYRARHKDGRWIWLEGRPTFTFDPDTGAPVGMISVVRDVTAQKEASEAIQRSEALYRLLAENSTDGIVQCDLKTVITYVSPACEAVLGYSRDEMIGQRTLDYVHPDDKPELIAVGAARIAAGPSSPAAAWQYRARHKDGRWIWIEGKPSVIFDEAGEATALQDVIRDITERKTTEDELARARAAAEAANVAKSEFLANMSHEIRTPLTAVIGFSGLLEQIGELPVRAKLYVQRIVTGGQALLAVVNDILDFSKLEARQVILDPQPFDPSEFLEGAIDLVADQAARKGLDLVVRQQTPLPGSVEADCPRLRQVLLNLLSNAIKFTADGGIVVTAGYQTDTGDLQITVADTGCGISPDKLDHLFERFSQVDSSVNRQHGGTGLGLAICKNLIDLMGGRIWVESAEGAGSTFSFTVAAPALAPSPGQAAQAGDDRPVPMRSGKILIVDDLSENRELARTLLEAAGQAVVEASTGADAVKIAISQHFDLILMDLQMPGMDGLAATQVIRATAPLNLDTPILALSANVLPDQIAQCRAAGMDDHVAKPIKVSDLLGKVSWWLGRGGGGPGDDIAPTVYRADDRDKGIA
ncbi:MAG TPA: PAS domain S-box protein [Caulobacteraceae bacterium]|jgi:PAS domain S-box-containing protein